MSKCRICGKELVDGVGRYNDHILMKSGGKITAPICGECAEERPDRHHLAFKQMEKQILKDVMSGETG